MTLMHLVHLFAEHADRLLLGVTAVLAFGCIAAVVVRSPVTRKAAIETTFIGCLLWLAFAFVPRAWIDAALPATPPRISAEAKVGAESAPPVARAKQSVKSAPPILASRIPAEATVPRAVGEPVAAAPVVLEPSVVESAMEVQPPNPIDWRQLLTSTWLVGAALAVAYLTAARILLSRALRRAAPAPEWLQTLAKECGAESVRLLVSPLATRPFCFGLRQPTILLPVYCAEESRRTAVGHVLRHELAHIRCRDAAGRRLANLLLPALYFHPLYWRLRSQWVLAAELLADDAAARSADPVDYVRELTDLVRARRSGILLSSGLNVFAREGDFSRRMRMLLQRKTPLAAACSPWRRAALLTTVVACVAAVGVFCLPPANAINAVVEQTQEPQSAQEQFVRKQSESEKPDPIRTMEKSADSDPKLFELHMKRVELSRKFGRSHPEMVAIEAKINAYTAAKQEQDRRHKALVSLPASQPYVADGKWRAMTSPGYWHYVRWTGKNWQWARWTGSEHEFTEAPTKAKPVTPPPYVLGPSDVVTIEDLGFVGREVRKGPRVVSAEGTISLGHYGSVQVAGKTVGEAKEEILKVLRMELKEPEIDFEIVEYNSASIYISAMGKTPTRLSPGKTRFLFDALVEAGFSKGDETAEIYRAGGGSFRQATLVASLKELWIGAENENYQLFPSDRIIVILSGHPHLSTGTGQTPVKDKPPAADPFAGVATQRPESAKSPENPVVGRRDPLAPPSRLRPEEANTPRIVESGSTPSLPMLEHQLRVAQAEIRVAEAKYEAAARAVALLEKSFDRGALSAAEFEKAKSAARIAEAELVSAKTNADSIAKLLEDLRPEPLVDLRGIEKDVERIVSLPRDQQAVELMKMPLGRQLVAASQVERKLHEKAMGDRILPADVEAEVQRIASLPEEQHEFEIVKKPLLLRKAYAERVQAEYTARRLAGKTVDSELTQEVKRVAAMPYAEREKAIDAKPKILQRRFRDAVNAEIRRSTQDSPAKK